MGRFSPLVTNVNVSFQVLPDGGRTGERRFSGSPAGLGRKATPQNSECPQPAIENQRASEAWRRAKRMVSELEVEGQVVVRFTRGADREGELDIGFLSNPVTEPGIFTHRSWTEPYVAVLPSDHPLAKAGTIRLRDLAAETFVSVTRDSSPEMYDQMMRDCRKAGITPSVVQEAGSWQATVSLVAAGMGLTIAPKSVGRLRIPRVTYRELSGPAPTYSLALCTGGGARSPAVEAYLKMCGGSA